MLTCSNKAVKASTALVSPSLPDKAILPNFVMSYLDLEGVKSDKILIKSGVKDKLEVAFKS